MAEKLKESVRLARDLITSALASLSKEERIEVLSFFDVACAKLVTQANAQVDELQAKLNTHPGK